MAWGGQRGFTLIEVLIVTVVLGVGLGGLARFLTAILNQEGQVRRHLTARMLALSALEGGGTKDGLPGDAAKSGWGPQAVEVGAQGPLRLSYRQRGGRREARVVWVEGKRRREVRLQAGYSRD